MAKELGAAGLAFEFFAAADGANRRIEIGQFYDEKRCIWHLGRTLSSGELGVFLSNHLIWRKCVAENMPVVVLEDDVLLQPGAMTVISAVEHVVARFGLLRLGGRNIRGRRIDRLAGTATDVLRFPRRLVGAYGYAIAPAAAVRLLARADRWVEPADEYIDRFWVHGVPIFGLRPFIVAHGDNLGASEIGAQRSQKLAGVAKVRRELIRVSDFAQREITNGLDWISSMGGKNGL
jgi:glycosyl transferase family 25